MCTVVVDRPPDGPARILALRDELTTREFDEPDRWWPAQPSVVGGRDRAAGGSWCVTDVDTGVTALVLNRVERRTGTPSRGTLPLAAVAHGDRWTDVIDHEAMASFTLLLVTPSSLSSWTWDTRELRRAELGRGLHMATPAGVDTGDAKTLAFAGRFADAADWPALVAENEPRDDAGALVVRHRIEQGVWATVFGQLIAAVPGRLEVEFSRTPWRSGTWMRRTWHS